MNYYTNMIPLMKKEKRSPYSHCNARVRTLDEMSIAPPYQVNSLDQYAALLQHLNGLSDTQCLMHLSVTRIGITKIGLLFSQVAFRMQIPDAHPAPTLIMV